MYDAESHLVASLTGSGKGPSRGVRSPSISPVLRFEAVDGAGEHASGSRGAAEGCSGGLRMNANSLGDPAVRAELAVVVPAVQLLAASPPR